MFDWKASLNSNFIKMNLLLILDFARVDKRYIGRTWIRFDFLWYFHILFPAIIRCHSLNTLIWMYFLKVITTRKILVAHIIGRRSYLILDFFLFFSWRSYFLLMSVLFLWKIYFNMQCVHMLKFDVLIISNVINFLSFVLMNFHLAGNFFNSHLISHRRP